MGDIEVERSLAGVGQHEHWLAVPVMLEVEADLRAGDL